MKGDGFVKSVYQKVSIVLIVLLVVLIGVSVKVNSRMEVLELERSAIQKGVNHLDELLHFSRALDFLLVKDTSIFNWKDSLQVISTPLADSIRDDLNMIWFARTQQKEGIDQREVDLGVLQQTFDVVEHNLAGYKEEYKHKSDVIDELNAYQVLLNGVNGLILIVIVILLFRLGKSNVQLLSTLSDKNHILEHSIDCIILTNSDGDITTANKAALANFGYSKEEILGRNASVLFESEAEEAKVRNELLNTGKFYGEVLNKKKNGEIFVSYLSANINYDLSGKATGSIGISRDITSEKELKNRFKELSDNAVDIIYTTDLFGNCNYVNNAAEVVMGYTREEMIGVSFAQIVHEDDFLKVANWYKEQFENKKHTSYLEFRVRTKEGSVLWVGQTVRTLFSEVNPKHILGFQGHVRDISERRQYEDRLKKSEANFKQIATTISDMFFLYNIEEDKYLYVSPNCTEVLGVTDTEFYSGYAYNNNRIYAEDLSRANDALEKIKKGIGYNIKYRIDFNRRTRWINEKGFPIKNEDGRIVSMSGTCRDVTRIVRANDRILSQNRQIGESIHYAKRIQQSSLPGNKEFKSIFPDSFVFFNPKDVVSGDFYLAETFRDESGNALKVLLVGDCTGHGIPGSILSLLSIALLKESMNKQNIRQPEQILESVRSKIISFFQSDNNSNIRDGLDLSLVVLDTLNRTLCFAGANLNALVIDKGEMIELKGVRQHIGYNERAMPFKSETITLGAGAQFYLFTDGYGDQFGGPNGKKFMKSKLKNLIFKHQTFNMEDQYEEFRVAFYEWKAENVNTDDVTLIGCRV